MSPLGIVAASGLLVGTFLTMIVIPVVYSLFESLSERAGAVAKLLTPASFRASVRKELT